MQDVRRTDAFERDPVAKGLDSWVDGWIARWKAKAKHSEDLWKLVDIPAPQASKKAAPERSAITDVTGLEEQPSLPGVIPEAAHPATTSQAPVVQRQVASSSVPQPGNEAPASAGQSAGEQTGDELDIDELARQVFHELRNKLSLEWERLRRR